MISDCNIETLTLTETAAIKIKETKSMNKAFSSPESSSRCLFKNTNVVLFNEKRGFKMLSVKDMVHNDCVEKSVRHHLYDNDGSNEVKLSINALDLVKMIEEPESRYVSRCENLDTQPKALRQEDKNQNTNTKTKQPFVSKNLRLNHLHRTNKRIRKRMTTNEHLINANNRCFIQKTISSSEGTEDYEVKPEETMPKVIQTNHTNLIYSENINVGIFSELRIFLKTVFHLGFDRWSNFTLDFNQLNIAVNIISRKFLVDFKIRSLYVMESLESLSYMKSVKRPEESYKFVFKHTYKNLKSQFKAHNPEFSKLGFNDFNSRFYKHYFHETACRLGISINQFFLPLTPDSYCNRNQNMASATINVSYITLICQSQVFLNDFLNYVNNSFIADYSAMIDVKVDNVCDKWEQMFIESNNSDKMIDYICDYVHTNKKCKLPWTIKEVEHAVDIVNKLVTKCKRKSWGKSQKAEDRVRIGK